jgi:3-dehydroquinate synthetase
MGIMSGLDGIVNDSHFKEFVGTFTFPKYVTIGLAVLAFLTWLAHGRSNTQPGADA